MGPKFGAVEQGDEAGEAKHIGASQLIPGVGRTCCRATERTRRPGVATNQLPLPEQGGLHRLGAATIWLGPVAPSVVLLWVAWAVYRLALQRGASSLPQRALALLKLKARRSSATRLLSPRGRRGFQEATEGVAPQRRLCS